MKWWRRRTGRVGKARKRERTGGRGRGGESEDGGEGRKLKRWIRRRRSRWWICSRKMTKMG